MSHRALASLAHIPLAATALALLALTGCSGTAGPAARPSSAPACRAPGKAILPHTDGTITESDNGARVCLAKGQEIAVFLNAHSKDPRAFWQPITARPSSALRRGNNGVMTLPVGVTAALFTPTAAGDIQLAGRRDSGGTWTATLVVH
ncbi:hypothetical protein ACH427_04985 [Streptomyces sp. NPDC020379]|uniref:hypothetical protein n=1 Tax=Streptomyces sp. NPDC020379 TaxID=3365071 RepID=UPI00379DB1F7